MKEATIDAARKGASALTVGEVMEITAEVTRTVIAPAADRVDAQGEWPEHSVRALMSAGLGGLVVPRDSGGLGHGLYATIRVCEIIGAECASSALCFGMHLVGSAVLAAKATEHQKREFLLPIAQGRHLTTLALSEPGTGAHFYIPQTSMEECDGGYCLDGAKSFVTNGGHADSYVVSTQAPVPQAAAGQFSCVVLPAGIDGISWGAPWAGFGMRGNSSVTMHLAGIRLPAENLLGNPGDQLWYVFEVVAPFFLMAMAGTYLGVAAAALEAARSHLGSRRHEHSGATLASSPILQQRLGALWSEVESARRLAYHAASLGDTQPDEALLHVLSAKAQVADCAVHVANEAMTLVGGIAYRENSRLARCLRDARAAHVMAPTTDLLRLWTGRAMLGVPLLAE